MAIQWKETIFSDGSEMFLWPSNPALGERITIRLRAWRHAPIERVFLRLAPEGEQFIVEMMPEMHDDQDFFTYYSVALPLRLKLLRYRFMIMATEEGKRIQWWYNQTGLLQYHPPDEFDFTVIADFEFPKWATESIFYQIFPDRFCDGNSETNVKTGEIKHPHFTSRARQWGETDIAWYDFFGGDLAGIKQRIPYLVSLGIGALYLTPIFTAPSNHKYDTYDYKTIDPHFGTNDEFAELVEALHQNGIRIILDAVLNHVGSGHPWFNKHNEYPDEGAFHNRDHPYREFFYFESESNSYASWQGYDTLVKLDYRSRKLRSEMYGRPDSVIQFWLNPPYKIDGWRIDVANMTARYDHIQLHSEVWEEFRKAVKHNHPFAYLLGETFYDPKELVKATCLDGAMNYSGFRKPLMKWLKGEEYCHDQSFHNGFVFRFIFTAAQMSAQLDAFRASLSFQHQLLMYNVLDSHDTERFLTAVGEDVSLFKLGVVHLFTYLGITGIYYGDEIGMIGGRDPDNRRCMEWNEVKWHPEISSLYRSLIALKKSSKALKVGSYRSLYTDDHSVVYARFLEEEMFVTLLSHSDTSYAIVIPLWKLGIMEGEVSCHLSGRRFRIHRGEVMITLAGDDVFLFRVRATSP